VNAALPATSLDAPGAQAAFVAAMQTPAAYAALEAAQTPIRLVETHVSWVFLTGRHAYKVKKPVRLSFLDYSTPARRAALCAEELRLNRRHAPDLYVDVVTIGGTPAAPRVGSHDGVFEHALRMVQFDPAQELGQLLQRDTVARDELAHLGGELARMHSQAAPAQPDSGYGEPDRVHRVTLDNFDEIGSDPTSPRLDALRARLDATFEPLRGLVERRRGNGSVRECHGDLHCGNVVRWHGRLVAFDGIEFDPALRFIDVASDLAFLTMDLAAHGRPDLRAALLDAWTTASGDYEAVELLPYFEPYRALVRAKVAALRGESIAAIREAARRGLRQYLDAAHARTVRAAPGLVVMAGLSGSGKTWLARRLAAACDALHVRSDIERKRLAGLGPLEDSRSPPDGGLYTIEFGERTYARMRDCARSCLRGGENVIIDAANLRRHERDAFVTLARDAGASVRIVHCVAPIDTLKRRIAGRSADASEATVDLLDRQPGYWEPFVASEVPLVHDVDTTDDRAVESAIDHIARHCRTTRA
jgi:aminoglycoside phosphotransferase family enzyme/predicted kinase